VVPDAVHKVEATCPGATARGPDDPAWSETLACAGRSLRGNREISRSAVRQKARRSASGKARSRSR